jgi:cytoskeletal protein CcmA (bactofilin family)
MWSQQTATEPQSQPQPLASDVDRSRPSVTPALNVARIGPNLTIKGSVTGEEDLQIDGKVDGPVTIRGRLTVGTSGQLTAGVTARELAVYGKVSGNVDARDRVDIKRDGAVIGDIQTARISIEDGAIFKGRIEIGRPAADQVTNSQATKSQAVKAVISPAVGVGAA